MEGNKKATSSEGGSNSSLGKENLRALDHSTQLGRVVENHTRKNIILTSSHANPDQLRSTIGRVWATVMGDNLEVIRELGMKAASQLWMLIPRREHILLLLR
jgi:hypothetical protein